MTFKLDTTVDLIMHDINYNAHAQFDDLDLDARLQFLGRGTESWMNYFDN